MLNTKRGLNQDEGARPEYVPIIHRKKDEGAGSGHTLSSSVSSEIKVSGTCISSKDEGTTVFF